MKYLLGIDFGGGASKATLLAENGTIVADNTVEYPTLYPEIGACEQAPADWIDALCRNVSAILEKSKIPSSDILAVAIDSATHTSLVCDSDFKPLRNAIHWTDTRSRKQADALREKFGEEIFAKTYHKPDTIWTLPQLLWLKEKEPETFFTDLSTWIYENHGTDGYSENPLILLGAIPQIIKNLIAG